MTSWFRPSSATANVGSRNSSVSPSIFVLAFVFGLFTMNVDASVVTCYKCSGSYNCLAGYCSGKFCFKSQIGTQFVKGCLPNQTAVAEGCDTAKILGIDTTFCYCNHVNMCNRSTRALPASNYNLHFCIFLSSLLAMLVCVPSLFQL